MEFEEIGEFANQMEIQEILNWYTLFLVAAALCCGVLGFLLAKITKKFTIGFNVLCVLSIISLFAIIRWFDQVSREAYMGTIPWLFNISFVLILFPIYLLVIRYFYKKVST
ncbi:hypothetical protein [Bacillus suaedaesalsae]|uniref:Uncharacterized protein n=1 Tax=Bacillus suaedaesalsae TaxID=2810349 RepID=A0ABS2DHA9_9BACI|nr:hypothetical protein [Bacillus suaedaesalsae]MBM6617802.1 hypothetical protein [Bacillus suaedaesalsae]